MKAEECITLFILDNSEYPLIISYILTWMNRILFGELVIALAISDLMVLLSPVAEAYNSSRLGGCDIRIQVQGKKTRPYLN